METLKNMTNLLFLMLDRRGVRGMSKVIYEYRLGGLKCKGGTTMAVKDGLVAEIQKFMGQDILISLDEDQLNILGQTFRPLFVGRVVEVNQAYVKLDPVVVKIITAPFFTFPTPLQFPLEKIIGITPLDRETIFPLQ
jgi:hypothetical protein